MRETCTIRLEAGRNLGLVQRFQFVARTDAGASVAVSAPFWSLSGRVFPIGPVRTSHRGLLHQLARAHWQAWGHGKQMPQGREWYAHRLYRDRPWSRIRRKPPSLPGSHA